MNGEYLYEAMSGISPVYVDEAENTRFSTPLWRKLVPLAACVAVLVGMYSGFRVLLSGSPLPEHGLMFLEPAGSPAAQAVVKHFRSSPWFNWGSLLLGLAAWILPLTALTDQEKQRSVTMASCIACILSLLLQVCNVLHRVNRGDFSTLSDTMWFVMLAAVVLVAGTAVSNGTVRLILHKPNSSVLVTILLILFFAWLLLWFLMPNHVLILGSSEVYSGNGTQAISDERAADLISLVNRAGGKRKAFSDYKQYPILEYTPFTTIVQHSQHFDLVYVYDNGFSFNPFHFGEDSAHFVLIKYNDTGEAVALWKMSYEFDEAYHNWRSTV